MSPYEKEVISTIKELMRMHVIHEINAGSLTANAAGEILGLSDRQVRRLIKRQRTGGEEALMHGHRSRALHMADCHAPCSVVE